MIACFENLFSARADYVLDSDVEEGEGGGGGRGGSESPASPTMFSHLPYFYALLSPDSHPPLCCSRLQVNQEDQKPRFNF